MSFYELVQVGGIWSEPEHPDLLVDSPGQRRLIVREIGVDLVDLLLWYVRGKRKKIVQDGG